MHDTKELAQQHSGESCCGFCKQCSEHICASKCETKENVKQKKINNQYFMQNFFLHEDASNVSKSKRGKFQQLKQVVRIGFEKQKSDDVIILLSGVRLRYMNLKS